MNVSFVSLGCPRNLVDTEMMMGRLLEAGHTVCSDPSAADCVVINTCAFIRPAIDESIDTILEMAQWKRVEPGRQLIVTGCLPQRYGRDLVDSLPEVDVFLGTGAFHHIEDVIRIAGPERQRVHLPPIEHIFEGPEDLPRLPTTQAHKAYIKIAEGCSGHCTYCIIPKLRGRQRSRPPDAIVREAEHLGESGVRELILVAQNTTAYGQDVEQDERCFPALLDRLAQIPGLVWIRILYGHPDFITDSLMACMASHPNICPYLDIPLQHASKGILEKMGRSHRPGYNLELLKRLRRTIPGLALRSSFIVGFPGETQSDFEAMVDFVEEIRFDHMGVFIYSDGADLPSSKLPGHIDDPTKQARFDYLMQRQAIISRTNNERYVGKTVRVLVEGPAQNHPSRMVGRTATQAPEIDGVVLIEGKTTVPGTFVDVRITHTDDYDLMGYIV